MSELLFSGGTIVTVDGQNSQPESVLVRDGKFEYIGSLQRAEQLASEDAIRIDLGNSVLLPGFIDAHSHPLWAAKTRGAPVVDVRPDTVPTYQALLAKIRRRVAVAEPGEHLLFFGLDVQRHPDMDTPVRSLLDEIAPDNPLGIQTSNCHALYLNSKGLEAVGIDKNTVTPPGSIIERNSNGVPTGMIAEALTWQALEVFYHSWGEDRLNEQFRLSILNYVKNGITTTTEHLYLPFYKAYYQSALNKGWPLPRIAAYQQAITHDMRVEEFVTADDRLWMAGVKIHADGSPFIGNIWLTQPYLDNEITAGKMNLKPGHLGGTNYPQAQFEQMLESYLDQGWRMTIHTQGDRTIDMVLDLVEDYFRRHPRDDHRFRLEHCALMREDQLDRASRLGVLCSFFINHISHWGVPIEDVLFGPERAAHYMPAGSAVRRGMRISLHADTPMTDPSALELMQAAMTRKAADGRVLGPDERLDALSALRAVTIDAAFQIGKEDSLGSIERGKYADLVVLGCNPMQCNAEQLSGIGIESTYIAGKKVWPDGH